MEYSVRMEGKDGPMVVGKGVEGGGVGMMLFIMCGY
jgi:hypothetical protein